MDDGFVLVTGKKAGKRRKFDKKLERRQIDSDAGQILQRKLEDMMKELEESQFYSEFKSTLFQTDVLRRCLSTQPNIHLDMICYGIGRLSECPCAQYQFALLVALRKEIAVGETLIYDPILVEEELLVAEKLGFSRIQQNEVCRRGVTTPTLFYMIHCSVGMYNNLLWANWKEERLRNVVLVGNPLSSYHLRLTEKQLHEQAHYIHKVLPLSVEAPLPSSFHRQNVFNDTSVHFFPSSMNNCNSDFWDNSLVPQDFNDDETIFDT